jgi:short-subunit dehydrogenase involved in D-alanine esterification of teichoic acids
MKHAVVTKDAIHFNLQVVLAASVQKRTNIQNDINTYLSQIQKQIDAGITQAQKTFRLLNRQTDSMIANVTAGLQATTRILTQLSSVPGCANEQTAEVKSIKNQIGILLYKFY